MNIKFTDEPEEADTGAGAGVTIPGAESLEVPDTAETEQPLTPGTPSALQLQLESYQELSGASPARLQSRWGQETGLTTPGSGAGELEQELGGTAR